MIYDVSIYNDRFFANRRGQHKAVRKLVRCLIDEFGPFKSSLDLGAGDGYYSHVLSQAGTEAHMVEVSEAVLPYVAEGVHCRIHDLREPLDYGRTFDLVLCIEVAEHLPESAADTLCDTMARHCGELLVFTAAPPGQKGDGHCNCQPQKYWREKLAARELTYSRLLTKRLRQTWHAHLGERHWWIQRNVMVWTR